MNEGDSSDAQRTPCGAVLGWPMGGWLALALLGLAGVSHPAYAQLLSAGKAGSYSTTTGETTWFSYKFGYRQNLAGPWSTSFDYLNEGHFLGHHRDGYTLELAYEFEPWAPLRTWVYAGVGPYYYFDTQTSATGTSLDVHRLAPAFTLTARHPLGRYLDLIVSLDTTWPNRDLHASTVTIGLGHWLGQESDAMRVQLPVFQPSAAALSQATAQTAPSAASARAYTRAEPAGFFETPAATPTAGAQTLDALPRRSPPVNAMPSGRNELAVYGAISVINIAGNPRSDGGSVEYRWRLISAHQRQYDLSVGYLYEGDPRVARRNGVTAQVWPVHSDPLWHIEVAAGFGAYAFIDRQNPKPSGQGPSATVAPVVSMMISSVPCPGGWFLRGIWDRVVSNYNRDADVWLFGLGRRF